MMDYPHRALNNKGIVDSGCSRHMTGNKAYLAEFQDFNGGPIAFGGSKGSSCNPFAIDWNWDEIYSTVDACKIAHEMWIAIERLQQVSSITSTRMVKYQKEVNEIRVERIAKNDNPLALVVAASSYLDPYYQAPKSHKPYAPTSKQSSYTRSNRTVTVAGARETVGSQVGQQSRIQCFDCKEFDHFAKECRKPKRVKDYTYHKENTLLCKQAEKGVPLQAEQADWLEDTDEEIDEQELEAHYSFMAKIQEVPTTDSRTDTEPLE
ncbi:integrase, catalytic region, zinc finger, CCHC-type containing protein [Tanacetum coccineum]